MSPNVGNFVHDLVEMAKAMETLPQVQAENERLTHSLDDALRTVQDRELAIIDYKSLIDSLNSRIRSLEVERDDASFRVLEAEDKAFNVLAMAKAARVSLDQMTGLLDPPKPEPELQPQVVSTAMDQGIHGSLPEPKPETFSGFEPQGSSEVNPSSSVGESKDVTHQVSADQSQVASMQSSPDEEAPKFDANPTPETTKDTGSDQSSESNQGPYFNKRYYYMLNYIDYDTWITGGGTEVDYHWRPMSVHD